MFPMSNCDRCASWDRPWHEARLRALWRQLGPTHFLVRRCFRDRSSRKAGFKVEQQSLGYNSTDLARKGLKSLTNGSTATSLALTFCLRIMFSWIVSRLFCDSPLALWLKCYWFLLTWETFAGKTAAMLQSVENAGGSLQTLLLHMMVVLVTVSLTLCIIAFTFLIGAYQKFAFLQVWAAYTIEFSIAWSKPRWIM